MDEVQHQQRLYHALRDLEMTELVQLPFPAKLRNEMKDSFVRFRNIPERAVQLDLTGAT